MTILKINLFKKIRMKKSIIGASFIVGVMLTVFVYQAVTIFQLRTQIANDHTTLTQVVDFLNQNIQAQQKSVTGSGSQQVSAPAATQPKK
jgi:hypothetical protein